MLSPRTRRRTLELLLDQAIQLSFPAYTYPEMRQLVRSRFHRFYERCLEGGMRREALARLADMTPQGMRNLGDARAPSVSGARGERLILLLLEAAGSGGLSFADLADQYEARCGPDPSPLEEALSTLRAAGRIERLPRGRYAACRLPDSPPAPILEPAARDILLVLLAAPGQSLSEADLHAALLQRGATLDAAALRHLEATGEVSRRGARLSIPATPSGHYVVQQPHAAILEVLLAFGVGAIAAVRQEGGEGPALASGWCLSLPADPEARWAVLAELRDRVAAWTAEAERHAGDLGAPLTTVEILLTAAEHREP